MVIYVEKWARILSLFIITKSTEMLNIVELTQTLISYEFNKYKLSLYNVGLVSAQDV